MNRIIAPTPKSTGILRDREGEMIEPKFGDRFIGIHASKNNPHRNSIYVETIHRKHGVMNPGKWYRFTDGEGNFWEYRPEDVLPFNTICPKCGAHDGDHSFYCEDHPNRAALKAVTATKYGVVGSGKAWNGPKGR